MGQESDTRSRQAWELAARQHGIVTRRQLLALGFGRRSIEHRVARGRLFPVRLGVYAVGWPALDRRRQWMAAILAGGDGAALSHRSAAALWEIGKEDRWIDVSVRRRCELRRPGVRFRGRPRLAPDDIVLRDDMPVTSPVQTLIDLATELDRIALERAVNDADKRDLIDPEALREELALAASLGSVPCVTCSTGSSSGSRTRIWRSTSAASSAQRSSRCHAPNNA